MKLIYIECTKKLYAFILSLDSGNFNIENTDNYKTS